MPEIRIRYDDDGDRMPFTAIAKVQQAAAENLIVTEFEWVRDDDLDPPRDEVVTFKPNLGGVHDAFTRAAGFRKYP